MLQPNVVCICTNANAYKICICAYKCVDWCLNHERKRHNMMNWMEIWTVIILSEELQSRQHCIKYSIGLAWLFAWLDTLETISLAVIYSFHLSIDTFDANKRFLNLWFRWQRAAQQLIKGNQFWLNIIERFCLRSIGISLSHSHFFCYAPM